MTEPRRLKRPRTEEPFNGWRKMAIIFGRGSGSAWEQPGSFQAMVRRTVDVWVWFDGVTARVMAQVGRGASVRNGPARVWRTRHGAYSDGEKVALLAPDLQNLLDARSVPEDLQARLYDAGVDNLPMLSAIAVDRNSLEALAKDSLGLDVTVRARDAIKLASLYLAWQSASKRINAQNEMDAEAVANKTPKMVPPVEMQLFRAEFEKRYYKLKDAECPGKQSFEDVCEQVDNGEFRPMGLRHFGSRNEDEEAESGSLQLSKTGTVKIRKARVETSNPTNLEEFRSKVMLMVNHYIFARFRYPNKTVLKDINPFTALEYLNYICSKDVSQLESQTVDGVTLHRPSLKLILTYEFYT